MDLMSSCNSGLHLGLKSEDEILSELIEGNHVLSHYTDTMSNDHMANCGHILISISGEYTVVCDACKGRFDTVESFSNHLKTVHWDYAVRRDGWTKTTNRKEPIGKGSNVTYQGNCNSVLAVHCGHRKHFLPSAGIEDPSKAFCDVVEWFCFLLP